jgi:hypothetical protein
LNTPVVGPGEVGPCADQRFAISSWHYSRISRNSSSSWPKVPRHVLEVFEWPISSRDFTGRKVYLVPLRAFPNVIVDGFSSISVGFRTCLLARSFVLLEALGPSAYASAGRFPFDAPEEAVASAVTPGTFTRINGKVRGLRTVPWIAMAIFGRMFANSRALRPVLHMSREFSSSHSFARIFLSRNHSTLLDDTRSNWFSTRPLVCITACACCSAARKKCTADESPLPPEGPDF